MKEAFELIKERLEPESDFFGGEAMGTLQKMYYCKGVEKALSIVSEVEAEYGNGWIPCDSGRMPVLGQTVLACINPSVAEHEIILTKYESIGYKYWHDGTVIAWMPLPLPYKPEKGA